MFDQGALLLAAIANATNDSQKVEPDHSLIRLELLKSATKELRVCKTESNWRTQSQQLLQGFQKVLKSIRLGRGKASDDPRCERTVQ